MSLSLAQELKDLETTKYGVIGPVRSLETKDRHDLSKGMIEMPHMACSNCGSRAVNTKYEKYKEMLDRGISSKEALDRLNLRYCCRTHILSPIIIQFSMTNKTLTEKQESLNPGDLVKLSDIVSTDNFSEKKIIQRNVELLPVPLPKFEEEEESKEEQKQQEEYSEDVEYLQRPAEELEYLSNVTPAEEQIPDWDQLDINKQNTMMISFLDGLFRNLEDKEYLIIYPDWNSINGAEKERRKFERKQKIIELSKLKIWDITPKDVKIDKLLEILFTISEDEQLILNVGDTLDDIDYNNPTITDLETKMDELVGYNIGIEQNWRDTILIGEGINMSQSGVQNLFNWRPNTWDSFSSNDKNKYLIVKIESYISEALIQLSKENWRTQLVEMKRRELRNEMMTTKLFEEHKTKRDRVTKIISSPDFYKAYYQELLQKYEEREEGVGGKDLSASEIALRKHILANVSTISEIEAQKKFKERYQTVTKISNAPSPDDEFIDVGAGYKVRVLRRKYKAD